MDEDSIVSFMAVTNCKDIKEAINYLEFGGGDLEAAIQLYFATGMPLNNPPNQSNDIREPINAVSEIMNDGFEVEEHDLEDEPFRSIIQTTTSIPGPLSKLFESPHDIIFNAGHIDLARNEAKKEKKMLMITIHDPAEFTCQRLNRDLWSDKQVKALIIKHFIFCQFNSKSSPGLEHLNYYPFSNFPYIAVLEPITGERIKLWNVFLEPDEFIIEVMAVISPKYEPVKKRRMFKAVTMLSEEKQLELAMKASATGTSIPEFIEEEEIEEIKDEFSIFQSITPFCSQESSSSSLPGNMTRIQFRFPDGKRVVKSFEKSAKIRDLFAYIKTIIPSNEEHDKLFEVSLY